VIVTKDSYFGKVEVPNYESEVEKSKKKTKSKSEGGYYKKIHYVYSSCTKKTKKTGNSVNWDQTKQPSNTTGYVQQYDNKYNPQVMAKTIKI
jgi:hypothetical protein